MNLMKKESIVITIFLILVIGFSVNHLRNHAQLLIDAPKIDLVLVLGVYFFLHLVVAQGMALMVSYGSLHFLGFSVPVLVGGFTVSAVMCRLAYLVAEMGGLVLEPWRSAGAWVENSEVNVGLVNGYLASRPLLGIGLVLMSLCIAFLFAGLFTWASSRPALGLAPVYLAVLSYSMPTFFEFIALINVALGGGHMGVFVPDVFGFIDVGKGVVFLVVSGLLAFIVAMGLMRLRGRLDSLTGVGFKGSVLFLGGGIMGLAGCLHAFYYMFVVQANYSQSFWGWWSLLMLVLAGFDWGWRLLAGVVGVQLLRGLVIVFRAEIARYLFFPVVYFESLLLGLFLILGLVVYQKMAGRLSGDGGSA